MPPLPHYAKNSSQCVLGHVARRHNRCNRHPGTEDAEYKETYGFLGQRSAVVRGPERTAEEADVRSSINARITLAVGLPLLFIWLGVAWWEYRVSYQEALSTTESYLIELTARQAAELDTRVAKVEQLAETLATVVTHSPNLSEQEVKEWLEQSLRANPNVFGVNVTLEPGTIADRATTFAPYYYRDARSGMRYLDLSGTMDQPPYRDLYAAAKASRGPTWSDPYYDEDTGSPMMCTCMVPFPPHGECDGIVAVDVLSTELLDHAIRREDADAYCTLVDRNGHFISHPDASRITQQAEFRPVDHGESSTTRGPADEAAHAPPHMLRIVDDRTGRRAWMVRASVPSTGWSLVAVIPEWRIVEPIREELFRSLGLPIAACLAMLCVVWLVSTQVTRPIRRLTAATESLAEGDLETRVPEGRGDDEVARLGRTFNTMVVDLKRNVEARIREEAARKEVEGEVHAARKIQAALLPRPLPDDPDREFSLYAVNEPARTVAGDFFDYFYIDEHTLAVVLADVSGEGVPAAIYMAVARTMLRGLIAPEVGPADVVTQLNRRLAAENDDNMFVTLFVGYYDVDTGELAYVNAGHNPPYVVREDGRLEWLDPTGPLVAPFPEATFRAEHCRLDPHDLAVFYTDGVTEAVSPAGELYGEARLESLLSQLRTRPPRAVCEGILETVDGFVQGDLPDDATVLVLGRTCPGAAAGQMVACQQAT